RHRFGDSPTPHCPRCPTLVEDSRQIYTSSPRVAPASDNILQPAILLSVIALTNRSLYYLAWSARPARMEAGLTLAVITLSTWAWETRDLADPLLPADYQVKIALAAAGGPHPSLF
ncbi:MAG: hypothetical protein ACK56F_18700, partial [bacterium]